MLANDILDVGDKVASIVGAVAGVTGLGVSVATLATGRRARPRGHQLRRWSLRITAMAALASCALVVLRPTGMGSWVVVAVSGLAVGLVLAHVVIWGRRRLVTGPLGELLDAQLLWASEHPYHFFGAHVTSLASIYVEQQARNAATEEHRAPHVVTITRALGLHRHVLLVAGPGEGKSSLVRQSVSACARWWLDARWSADLRRAPLAEWIYDTLAKGKLTSATRFAGGNAYTDAVTGYDVMGRPTGSTFTIPSAEGLLAGTYTFTTSYTTSGAVAEHGMPAAGGLPAEKVTSTYTDLGLAHGLTSDLGGGSTYVQSTGYTATGRPSERTYGATGKIKRALAWDPANGWLNRITTSTNADATSPTLAQDDQYFYDVSGEITRVLDAASAVSGSPGQSECFTYDGLHRLATAFTTTGSSCTAGADTLGADPYSQSFAYDGVGNMTSLTDGGQTSTYGYPSSGASAVRPNAVTSIARTGGTDTYGYDTAGQLTSRTVAGKQGSFVWNELGQMDKATIDGADTTMIYDADGERLIRRDPGGKTTLFLGSMEIEMAGDQITGKRYYTAPDGATVAMRTGGSGVTWLLANGQGSEQLAIDDVTGNISRQRYLPYGGRRGGRDDITVTNRGFLGKTEDDSTGLVLLGARYYDPAIAKFTSPDPLINLERPQNTNAYGYGAANPERMIDPTGFEPRPWHDPKWNKKSAKQRKAITKRYMAGERRVARQVAARQRAQALSGLAADKKGLAEKQEKAKSGKDKPQSKPGGFIDKLAGAFDSFYRGGTILDTCSLRGGSCSYNNGFIGDPTTDAYKSGAGQDQRYNYKTGTVFVPGGGSFFRGSRSGQPASFQPRPNDFKVDPKTGYVKETHGVSVFDNSASVSSKGFVPNEINNATIPDSLRIIQRGADPRHYEIVPRPGANLTPEEYMEAVCRITCK